MNGHTRESKHRIAVLEEEDVETFVAFCEYAYTGDYSVPQPEEPEPEEDPKSGVMESAFDNANWRQAYRTGSVASTVPPPAPSPPPEQRYSTRGSAVGSAYQESQPDTLVPECPTPVPEPEPATEPEVNPEEPPAPEAEPASAPEHEDDIAVYEEAESAPAEPESEAPAEEFPEVAEEPTAVPPDEPAQWELEEAPVKSHKKLKGKKGKKGKKGHKEPPVEAEPPCEPVNLTPPSTPSPVAVPDPGDDGWQAGPWTAEPAPAAEPEPEPEPPVEDWQPEPSPKTAAPMEDSWIQDRASRHRPMLDMSFAQQQAAVSPCEPGQSLWDEFASLQYNDESDPKPPTFPTLPYLTFHAKVYVFATRYLIPALAQLCLRKLHADLLTLPEEPVAQAQIILDLVHYAYTKTTRLEPISPTSATQLRENELRRLVVHYAACKVKELARCRVESATATPALRPVDKVGGEAPKSLRALLDMTTELASDLVYRMM